MSATRISNTISIFNDYINNTYDYLQAISSDSNPNPDPGPPAADSKGMILFISTKCNFTLHLGDSNKTKILVVYMRWFNTKHPELAGSWSALQAIVIA